MDVAHNHRKTHCERKMNNIRGAYFVVYPAVGGKCPLSKQSILGIPFNPYMLFLSGNSRKHPVCLGIARDYPFPRFILSTQDNVDVIAAHYPLNARHRYVHHRIIAANSVGENKNMLSSYRRYHRST